MTDPLQASAPFVLACPDAFKQTASAAAIATAMEAGAHDAEWGCDRCPLSDGGEGFAQVLAHAGGGAAEMVTTVTGPLGQAVEALWYLAGTTAMIESAAASGLGLAGGAAGNDPVAATSRGTGELIVAAIDMGVRTVLVGVGGSATTDGGLGAVEAIEAAGGLVGVEVMVACDVETRFADAAAVFGPQKGASPDQVGLLADRLGALAKRYRAQYGVDVAALVGSGAAGGLAGGLAVLGASLVPGFEAVAVAVDLEARHGGLLGRDHGRGTARCHLVGRQGGGRGGRAGRSCRGAGGRGGGIGVGRRRGFGSRRVAPYRGGEPDRPLRGGPGHGRAGGVRGEGRS